MSEEKNTTKRKRRVYGRLYWVAPDGTYWRFEMETLGIRVRQRHQRFQTVISFDELHRLSKQQTEMFPLAAIVQPKQVQDKSNDTKGSPPIA